MEDNKEIVKWLTHVSLEGSCTAVPNSTLEKQQPVDDKQQIMNRTKVQNENPSLRHLQDAIAETTAEDTALTKEVSELLNELQISPQTLANDVKENLHKVSAVLRSNGLSDADETALIISMDTIRIREKKKQLINRSLKAKYEELLNRHSVLEKKLNDLKENVGLIRDSFAENEVEYKNEYSSYKLLTSKLLEYNTTASTIETAIDSLNAKELEPDKILEKYKRFMERKSQLAEINQALRPYGILPSDLIQAEALLKSKELEYKEVTEKCSNMTEQIM